jgi:hypothetical protein
LGYRAKRPVELYKTVYKEVLLVGPSQVKGLGGLGQRHEGFFQFGAVGYPGAIVAALGHAGSDNGEAGAGQGGRGSRELVENVGAVAALIEHLHHTRYLTLSPNQSVAGLFEILGVDLHLGLLVGLALMLLPVAIF